MNAPRIRFFDSVRGIALGLLLAPLLPAALTAWLHPSRPEWNALRQEVAASPKDRVDAAEAKRNYADYLWLDARPRKDFDAGHVDGALPLTEDDWEAQLPVVMGQWDGRQTMLVYCGGESCHASEAVARRLRRELVEVDVKILTGGWAAWLGETAKP